MLKARTEVLEFGFYHYCQANQQTQIPLYIIGDVAQKALAKRKKIKITESIFKLLFPFFLSPYLRDMNSAQSNNVNKDIILKGNWLSRGK